MQFKYVELARVSVEQLFYKNKICRQYSTTPELDFDIVPTQHSLGIFNRLDLVFRNVDTAGGFTILGRVLGTNAGRDHLLRFPAKKDDVLSFFIILKNPDLKNFNDLPLPPANDQVYYFANTVSDAAAPRNNLHLSQNAAGVSGANDVIKKSFATYRFHHTANVTDAVVKHVVTGQTNIAKSVINQGVQSDLIFDLTALPPGKCLLLIEGVQKDEFYFLGNTAAQPVFGVIDLFLVATIAANYRIIEPDRSLTATRPLYTILFLNRQTHWRYTVQLQTNSPLYLEIAALTPADKIIFLNSLNLITNDTGITFSKTNATDTVFTFESVNPLPLLEKYFSATSVTHDVLNITLKKYIGDAVKEAAVKLSMPFPSTNSIDASEPLHIFSDIFLTL